MPSGPKKRRAARKKSDGDASFTHHAADVKVEADAELSKVIVSKVSEVSTADVHAEAKPEIGLKENEGKETKEQTFFEESVKNLTKCSQMPFGGDLEDVKVHAELFEIIVSKVSEVSTAHVHAEAKPEISLKENEGKESKEQTFFEDSVIEQSLLNQNLTKCSQMSFGGDLEGVTLESIVQPLAEPVVDSDAADSLLELVQKEANGAFDKQFENDFNAPPPRIEIVGDGKDQADQEITTLLEQLLLLSTEGDMLAQKQMEVNKKVGQIHHKILDELKSQKRT